MIHIRAKINRTDQSVRMAYTIVNTSDYVGELSQHPILLEHPDSYELVNEEIPTDEILWSIEYLNYQQ
jgi:hypothetical protein